MPRLTPVPFPWCTLLLATQFLVRESFSRSLGDVRAKLAKAYSGCSPARLSLRGSIRIPILLRFDPLKALLKLQRRQLVHYPLADIRPQAAAGELLPIPAP